ncbi:MAG: Maf-like protein [Gemmatales bacterium]|nr:MAG: Maf-like protein [Gemmatales bacterium]
MDSLPFRIVLASTSPARRRLLGRAGFSFDVIPPNVEEPKGDGVTDVRRFVQQLAWLKAQAVADQLHNPALGPTVVLAADTVGWFQGQVIGKPEDEADALRIIGMLAGTRHQLWTGVCLWLLPANRQICWQEQSLLEMTPMSSSELDAYIKSEAWRGHSGGYAIEESGNDPLVKVVEGTVSNVIGLPMESLEAVFAQLKNTVSLFSCVPSYH